MVVHALAPPDHVMLTLLHGLIAPHDHATVWRHKDLSDRVATDASFRRAFKKAAELFLGDRYNITPMLTSRPYHTFCSELIGKVFQQFGYGFDRDPVDLLPADVALSVISDSSRWIDVTDEARNTLSADPLYTKLYCSDVELARSLMNALEEASQRASLLGAFWTEGTNSLDRFGDFEISRLGNARQTSLDLKTIPPLSELAAEWFWYFIEDATGVNKVTIKEDPWTFFRSRYLS